jgi:hypothetical protein
MTISLRVVAPMEIEQDPIETNPEFADLVREINEQAEANLKLQGRTRGMGFCHVFWREKKRLFKELHGIDWMPPRELNPGTRFD